MILRNPRNNAQPLQIEQDLQRSLLLLEYIVGLLHESTELEDNPLTIVHEPNEFLYQSPELLAEAYRAELVCHFIFVFFIYGFQIN